MIYHFNVKILYLTGKINKKSEVKKDESKVNREKTVTLY